MIAFQNRGLLDLRGITTFGLSVKESDNPIGYFGTGLKYAIAVLMKHGCTVTLYLGDKRHDFSVKARMFRGEEANVVFMEELDGAVNTELPFTEDLGKNWELWMAYRELAANCMDEPGSTITKIDRELFLEGYTTILVDHPDFDDVYANRKDIFLESKPRWVFDGLEIHDVIDSPGWVFYNGIRVLALPKRSLYTYNITGKLKLTEDRTISSISEIYLIIAKGISVSNDPTLIRQILMANHQYWESQIDYHWYGVKPGETFNKIVERMISGHSSFNSSARSVYRRDHPKEQHPEPLQWETIPMEQRRKLWAALMFWGKLNLEIPKGIVHVTTKIGQDKAKVVGGHIYLSKFVLEMEMRYITGLLYKLYAETKPVIGDIKQKDLLIDTIVDFGERLLGVNKQREVA